MNKRFCVLLVGLFLMAGQFVFLAPNQVWGQTDDSGSKATGDTILTFSSDVHNETNDISANRLAAWIDAVQGKYGKIDAMGFGGDLGDAGDWYNYWRNAKAVMDAVAGKGVDGVYTTGNHEFNPGDAQYNSQTHQLTSATGQAVLDNYKVAAEGKQGDNYRIFCLGSTSTTQGYWVSEKEAFESYMTADIGKDKPTVVITHFPLHFCIGNNWGDRTTANADLIIDFLNRAATNGTPNDLTDDRTIIFLWGHNHSEHDPYYDQVYCPGDSIEYSRGNFREIQFYYGGAGCMSDYEYGGTDGGSASVKGKGLVLQIRADDEIGFAYCDANGDVIPDKEGGHNDYPRIITDPIPVTGLSLNKETLTVKEGWTAKLTAAFEPANATNKNLTWTVSPESVVTITPQGNNGTTVKVKGISEGTATITATSEDGEYTASSQVTVTGAEEEQYYVIRIGDKAMSSRLSSAVRIEPPDNYEYHGLEAVSYSPEAAAPHDLLWTLEPTDDTENGYYIKNYAGEYLSATYEKQSSGNGWTGTVTVGDTKDVWIIEEDPENWSLNGGWIKSKKLSPSGSNNRDKYLAVRTGTEGNNAEFFTIRSDGAVSTLSEPAAVEEHVHTLEKVDRVKPTTETEGTEAYWKCSECGALFSDEEGTVEITEPVKIDKLHPENPEQPVNPEQPAQPTQPAAPVAVSVQQMGSDGTALGPGASAAAADKAITSMKNDGDPAGSAYSVLKLRSLKQSTKAITLNWNRAKGAAKYVIYGNRCGKKNKMKKIATVKKNRLIVKKAVRKVTKGKYYKFIVVALDKNNKVVSTSKVIHVAAAGTKAGNYKGVTIAATVVKKAGSLKKGKSLKLGAKFVPTAKKKVSKHRPMKYESTNPAIATVTKKGVVKARTKGICYISAYAQNGVFKKIKVIVK